MIHIVIACMSCDPWSYIPPQDSEDEDEPPQQISKRARHTPIIMSDSEDEEQKVMQPVPKTKATADRKFSFHAAQGPARSSHQAPCTDRSSSSVKTANLDITPIKTGWLWSLLTLASNKIY